MAYIDTIRADRPMQYRRLGSSLASQVVTEGVVLRPSGQFIRTGATTASTFLSAGAWSIGLWVRSIPNGATSFIFGSSNDLGIRLKQSGVGENYIEAYNLVSGVTHSAGVPYWFTNNPIHVVATNNGSSLSLYVDGVLSARSSTGATTSLAAVINTGHAVDTNLSSLTMWGMGTWNRVLSEAEVAAWYTSTTPSGPTGFWPATEGTGNTCFNVGGSAGINLSVNSGTLRWSNDRISFSIVGSVPTGASLLPSDPSASSSVFDGNAANYILGEYYDWTGPDRIFECWIKPTAYQPVNRTAIFSTQFQGVVDIKNLRMLAGGERGDNDLYGLALGQTYHIVTRFVQQNLIRCAAVWINGRLVGKRDFSTSGLSVYGEQTLYVGQFFNGSIVVAASGLIGELQEFASYAGIYGNEFANKHYNAGIDVTGYPSALLTARSLGANLVRAQFNKPTYGDKPENFAFVDKTVQERYELALVDVLGISLAAAQAIAAGATTIALVETDLLALVGASTITENESYLIFKKVDVVAPTPYKVINNFDGTMDIYSWMNRPLVYLKLNEASGTVFEDSSGYGYDGYSVGSVTPGVVGIVNRAADFSNASLQYIVSPSNPRMASKNTKGFSVNFWMQMSTLTGTTKYIISQHPAVLADGGWAIYANAGRVYFEYAVRGAVGYTSLDITTTLAIVPGTWTMFTVTFSPSPVFTRIDSEPRQDDTKFTERILPGYAPKVLSWYNDGIYVGQSAETIIGYDTTMPLVIGNRSNSLSAANGFPGKICEVSYFDYALTPDEVYFLAQQNTSHRHMPEVGTPQDGRTLTLTTTNLTDALNDPLTTTSIDFAYQELAVEEPEWEGAEFVDGFQLISSGETTIISNTVIYNMRAYDSVLSRYVTWTVEDSPDFAGAQYVEGNPANLTDIILFKTAVQE